MIDTLTVHQASHGLVAGVIVAVLFVLGAAVMLSLIARAAPDPNDTDPQARIRVSDLTTAARNWE